MNTKTSKVFGETERLILRKMTPDDFNEIFQIMRSQSVQKIWEHCFTDVDIKDWIKKNQDLYSSQNLGYFLAIEKQTGKAAGQIALMPDTIDGKIYYEIGYILKEEFMKKGFALEGAGFMADYAFKKLGLKEVIFEIRPVNTPSIKVAEKLGAKNIGSFIKNVRGKKMEHFIFILNT